MPEIIKTALIVLGIAILYKLIKNLQNYLFLKRFYRKFNKRYKSNISQERIILSKYSLHLKKILVDIHIPVGTVTVKLDRLNINPKADPFDYLDIGEPVVNSTVISWVHQGIGEYKKRMFDAFNPVFWIDTFVFLPQRIILYFGGYTDNWISKLLSLMWWIVCFFVLAFSAEVRALIALYL